MSLSLGLRNLYLPPTIKVTVSSISITTLEFLAASNIWKYGLPSASSTFVPKTEPSLAVTLNGAVDTAEDLISNLPQVRRPDADVAAVLLLPSHYLRGLEKEYLYCMTSK
jgi:hypothetical protein